MRPTMETVKLWIALNLAQRSVYRDIEAALKEADLPPLRWYDILWSLQHSKAGVRAKEMEKSLLFEQSNLSRLLRKMIVEGLIEEHPCEQDRRAKLLHTTQKGTRIREQMWEVYGENIQKYIGSIPENYDAPQITEALTTLVESEVADHFK